MIDRSKRSDFFAMPAAVVDAVHRSLESPVVRFGNAVTGFSSGPAGRADLGDGRVVFLKACSKERNLYSFQMHREEARLLPLLPAGHPSPSLLTTVEVDDWIVLVTEFVDGITPVGVIDEASTAAVLDLVSSLVTAGTPCPSDRFPVFGAEERKLDRAWTEMVRSGAPDGLDAWSRRHLSELAALEADWLEAVAGDSLLHGDLRPDNMVLTDSGGVAVDWPGASRGAPWVDLVGLLPSLEMLDGPKPHAVFAKHPVGAAADAGAVDSFLALLAGYFTSQSLQPPIPNVPGVRQFQAAQAAVCRTWMSDRFGWDPPEA